jgi:menaquinone-dependent protoporphyrinogen IX oxidase
MKGVVVYQSKWGNSRQVAEAIARGLEEVGHEVTAEPVGSLKELSQAHDFIVVGGPTRMGRAYGPIKRFAKRKVTGEWAGKPFATFSTGASILGEKPSPQAAERLRETLESNGLKPIAEPFKAGVEDMHGPLAEGELDRALEFGREIGAKLSG